MIVKSLLFICVGLSPIFSIRKEAFYSVDESWSQGVNRRWKINKKPFPPDTKPICYKRRGRCFKRIIIGKFYIQDELKQMLRVSSRGYDIDKLITGRIDSMLNGINKRLHKLDNGGYHLIYNEPFVLLSDSDVKIKRTYTDRLDNNKRKTLNPKNEFAVAFAFQEAIESLPCNDVTRPPHIRILLRIGNGGLASATEEKCICNPDWKYACVSVLSVLPDHWKQFKNNSNGLGHPVYAHEIGHALGRAIHDDVVYYDPAHWLLMNANVGGRAFLWSPEAKQDIRQQFDKYHRMCLSTDEARSETSYLVEYEPGSMYG